MICMKKVLVHNFDVKNLKCMVWKLYGPLLKVEWILIFDSFEYVIKYENTLLYYYK